MPARAKFLAEHQGAGCVLGGTAWTLANESLIERGGLDLLVIDEAGQFSLPPTLGASAAAQRLLLFGDPQQLPQINEGTHADPVDESALGWLMDGHDTISFELGYFRAELYRMHPASVLSYDGRLKAAAPASARHLEDVDPGLHAVVLDHTGIAAYYGYDLDHRDERLFALAVLSMGTAAETGKAAAYIELNKLVQALARPATWEQLQRGVVTRVIEEVFTRLGFRLTQRKVGQAVPIVGTLIGAGMNARLLSSVTNDAEQIYRERFLRDRYGLEPGTVTATQVPDESDVVDVAEILEGEIAKEGEYVGLTDEEGEPRSQT